MSSARSSWVVVAEQGEYSDYEMRLIGVCESEPLARDLAAQAEKMSDRLSDKFSSWLADESRPRLGEKPSPPTLLDPGRHHSYSFYDSVKYSVKRVPWVPEGCDIFSVFRAFSKGSCDE